MWTQADGPRVRVRDPGDSQSTLEDLIPGSAWLGRTDGPRGTTEKPLSWQTHALFPVRRQLEREEPSPQLPLGQGFTGLCASGPSSSTTSAPAILADRKSDIAADPEDTKADPRG